MKGIFKLPARWPAIFAVIVLAALICGCDGSSSTGTLPERNTYRLEGVLVSDLNAESILVDTSRVAIRFERNDSLLTAAQITFGSLGLVFNRPSFALDSVYSFPGGLDTLLPAGAYEIGATDSSRFADTVVITVPDTFRIEFYTGDSTVPNTNGQELQINWTAAANVEGYVVAVVLEDSAYRGYGYSQYVTSQTTETTIPPDAFRLSAGIGGEPDTGWYDIFVYGFSGLPDSSLTAVLLPVPLPSRLGDNIDLTNFSGRFGSVTVTRRVKTQIVSSAL